MVSEEFVDKELSSKEREVVGSSGKVISTLWGGETGFLLVQGVDEFDAKHECRKRGGGSGNRRIWPERRPQEKYY
ncbi:hypothetical protein CL632_00700 [bacterium]|nr:hypothetical protein [bacterium]MDP6571492.1 hypothetical protein [Patescibacteria group bacterium]